MIAISVVQRIGGRVNSTVSARSGVRLVFGSYIKELHREQLSHTTSNLEVHRWADVIIIAWK